MRIFAFLMIATMAVGQTQSGRLATDWTGRVIVVESMDPLQGDTGGLERILSFEDGLGRTEAATNATGGSGGVIGPKTNDNGDLRGYTFYRHGMCFPIGGCSRTTFEGVVRHARDGWEVRHEGRLGLSREGRWAVFAGANFGTVWVDLWTGESTVLSERELGVGSVADDGSIAAPGENEVVVYGPGREPRRVALPFTPRDASIDRTGTMAAVFGENTLARVDLDSGVVEVLAVWDNVMIEDVGPRGGVVLFSQWGVFYTVREAGVAPVRLGEEGQQIEGAALLGDGAEVMAKTLDGVARYAVDGGAGRLVIVGATGFVAPVEVAAPGQWLRRTGWGTVAAEMTWSGRKVEPLQRAHGELQWVVPEETALGAAVWEVGQPGSPFAPYREEVEVQLAAPTFLVNADLGQSPGTLENMPIVRHVEDGSPVTWMNPARSGESIEVLMTGLNGQGAAVEWLLNRIDVDSFVYPVFEQETVHPENPAWRWVRLKMPEALPSGLCSLGAVYGKSFQGVVVAVNNGN